MAKNENSAESSVMEERGLIDVRCKICKRHGGYSEHYSMNMFVCDSCMVWYNRELFKSRFWKKRGFENSTELMR